MEKKLKKFLHDGQFKDVPEVRSKTMAAIKSKNNKTTELKLRMLLVRNRISGWKMNCPLKGTPDFYFSEAKLAVFIDGCYWHGCPKCGHIPKTRTEFWTAKIARNRARDQKITRLLKKQGITVLRFWEHQLKIEKNANSVLSKIIEVQRQ